MRVVWTREGQAREQVASRLASLMGTRAAEAVAPMIAIGVQGGQGVLATTVSTAVLLFSATGVFVVGTLYSITSTGRLNLKPGASKLQPVTVTIPAGTFPGGNYFLHVRVDAELNLTNGQTVVVMPFSIS